MRRTLSNRWFAVAILALLAPLAVLAQDVDEDAEADAGESEAEAIAEEPIELSTQVVTGSRLRGGDPSSRVHSLSAEDIAVRGVSSLEDLFRTLPWAFSSISTQTNMVYGAGADDTDKNLGALGLGTSTVNLRALGSANTLVLINGRRVAGAAGDEDGFVNLLNVPLSAIERVDIQIDGASAVYGSDAIGGVVNFITKKNYRGFSATYRNEFSSTSSDRSKLSLQGGFSWLSGNVTATASRATSSPINNFKIYTSTDFRDQFGPEFDQRTTSFGQPGVVCDFNYDYEYPDCDYFGENMQLSAGHSGVGARSEDFTTDIAPIDYVSPQNGEDSTTTSFTISLEQYITDSFRVNFDVLVSDVESYQESRTILTGYLIPANNAHNPFDGTVLVSYFPRREIETGLIPRAYTEAENKQRNYSAGFFWEIGDGHQLEVNVTRSNSEKFVWQIDTDWTRSEFDPTQEKFYAALENSDPNVALNLFGDGTAQGSAFAELFTNAFGPVRGYSQTTTVEPLIRGQLFHLWGGPISYAVGGEIEKEVIHSHEESHAQGGPARTRGREDVIGVKEPTQDLTAYFAELAFPIVGADNSRPGLRSLVLSVQARRDIYKSKGASGGVDMDYVDGTSRVYVPGEGWQDIPTGIWAASGTPELIETKQSATSPRVGLQYKPTENFVWKAAWSRSFQPPAASDLYHTENPFTYYEYFTDPYHPDGAYDEEYEIPVRSSRNNPDLKSEFADKYSLGFDWTPQTIAGLRWAIDWSRINFTNKIDYVSSLFYDHPEIVFPLPNVVVRNAEGYITRINDQRINLAEKISEILETRLEYAFDTGLGSFSPRLTYTRVLDEHFRVTPDSAPINRVGTTRGSNRYKVLGSLTWTSGRFAADLFIHYTPSYENDRTGFCVVAVGRCPYEGADLPALTVDSLTTVDLALTYSFDNGLRIRAGGRNIFDADSPTVWESLPYDATRWDARGQVLYLDLKYEL